MFIKKMVSRLRAAHALSFAMTVRMQPGPADLEEAGLGGADWKRLVAQFDARAFHPLDEPEAAAAGEASPIPPAGQHREWPVALALASDRLRD